jgi:betaine-aldehyde dehydrogenase
MINRTELYINGEWCIAGTSGHFDIINPATETQLGRVPMASLGDGDRAADAALTAFETWRLTTAEERRNFLLKIHDGLKLRIEDVATTICAEVGMPIKMSRRIQAGLPLAVLDSYIELLETYSFEEYIGNSLVIKEPAGVALCITPWNYPLHQVVAKLAAALAAGCTVVLKPSEVAPLSAFILADIIHEAGLPAGVFNLVTGTGAELGEHLVQHPAMNLVSFTGSLRGGRRVAELAAATVKRVTLELGGKSAAVLLDDADFATAVKTTVGACFLNSGQTCTAHTRLLVPEDRYAEVVGLAVAAAAGYAPGDPFNEQTRLGPLVSSVQRDRVREYIQSGIDQGAELLTGGVAPPEGLESGYFVRPTVFGRVTPDMTIAREEIFGPVLSIMTYHGEEEAIRIANDTPYGLAAAVWSGDRERAVRVSRHLRTGQVDINGGAFNLLAPFGGCKQSGHGRELGIHGLSEFLELKSLQLPQ